MRRVWDVARPGYRKRAGRQSTSRWTRTDPTRRAYTFLVYGHLRALSVVDERKAQWGVRFFGGRTTRSREALGVSAKTVIRDGILAMWLLREIDL